MRLIATAMLALCAAFTPVATGQLAQEHEVKAAFLYKFPAFVEWPEGTRPDVPFVIAVAGAPGIAAELSRIAEGREIHGRPIRVRALKESEAPGGAQLLFAGREARLRELARSVSGTPTLLVSEVPGGLDQGAMINFVLSDGRVRFEVAPDAAERSGLRISSRLLAVAQSVRGRL